MIVLINGIDLTKFTLHKGELKNNDGDLFIDGDLKIDREFINNGTLVISGSIILNDKLVNNGKIYLLNNKNEYTLDRDLYGNARSTGIIFDIEEYRNIKIAVLGPLESAFEYYKEFEIGKKNSSFYFSRNGGKTSVEPKIGDELFYNETFAKSKIYSNWRILIIST